MGTETEYKKRYPKQQLSALVTSPNIAALLPKEQLDELGSCVVESYTRDKQSREEWEQRNEESLKLALQVVEQKSFPWSGCSNVKFPLLTIGALQFLARISVLTKGKRPAKVEVIGADVTGEKFQRAQRISTHLSMQLTDDDPNWVDDDEKAKLAASIIGSAFKKTYFDSELGTVRSMHVPAQNLVVDYYCKNLDSALRITHVLSLPRNRIQGRVAAGLYLEMTEEGPSTPVTSTDLLAMEADESSGLRRPAEAEEFEVLEQHNWHDFDGDGYAEPYIMTVRRDTKQVLRIVARYLDEGDVVRKNDVEVRKYERDALMSQDPKTQSMWEKEAEKAEKAKDNAIIHIQPVQYFTQYTFIPSPDGGFYGFGLGALLGPVNESVNTLVNQLIDAGTMSNSAGGFLGRGVKVKGGQTSFTPFEWKPVDTTGDDLRKGIFPLPIREPSNVLFQLLGLLVGYGEKISGSTDIMTGVSPGQNTPAETSRNTMEQGMMLFSGIYSRMYRSFREELRKFYNLNRLFLETSPYYTELTEGEDAIIAADDYSKGRYRIVPAADAASSSALQRKTKADTLLQVAASNPGFNRYLVVKDWLEAHEYDNIDNIFPDPQGPKALPPPVNPKVQIEQGKIQIKQAELAQAAKEFETEMQVQVVELKSTLAVNEAKIVELEAKATKLLAEADGVEVGHQISILNTQIAAAKARQEGALKTLDGLQKLLGMELKHKQEGAMNGNNEKGQRGMGTPGGDTGISGTPEGS